MIYFLSIYEGNVNKNLSNNPFELIKTLNPAFFRHKFLDGYILDLIEINTKTVLEKQKLIQSFMDILYNKNPKENSPIPIPIESKYSKIKLFDIKNKELYFKDILTFDKKYLIIDFWASWCVPCISEIPNFEKYSKKYGEKIKFITISIDEDKEKWINGIKKNNMKNDCFIFSSIKNNQFIKDFEIFSIPRYILVNKNGEVISSDFYRPSDIQFQKKLEENTK